MSQLALLSCENEDAITLLVARTSEVSTLEMKTPIMRTHIVAILLFLDNAASFISELFSRSIPADRIDAEDEFELSLSVDKSGDVSDKCFKLS